MATGFLNSGRRVRAGRMVLYNIMPSQESPLPYSIGQKQVTNEDHTLEEELTQRFENQEVRNIWNDLRFCPPQKKKSNIKKKKKNIEFG